MKKIVIGIVLAAVVAFAGYLYFRKDNGVSQYRTAKVEKGEIVDAIAATGTINAVTTVSVGSQVSGTIQQIFVDFNSRVSKGQVIALIDPRLLEAAVEQARANVNNAKASLEKAQVGVIDTERTNRRNRELVKDGFVAQADVDSSQTAWEQAVAQKRSAEAALQQAEGALRVAKTNLEYATIRSPVNGTVISRNVDVGQTVAASFQTPTLFSIAEDLTKMQVDTNVDESDIGRAALGQTVTFTVDAWPEKTFTGEVAQVRNSPIVTQNVVTYNVVVRVDNRDLLLKPGMTANVSIEVKKFKDVLKIPNAALRYRPTAKGTEAESAGKRPGNGKGKGGGRAARLPPGEGRQARAGPDQVRGIQRDVHRARGGEPEGGRPPGDRGVAGEEGRGKRHTAGDGPGRDPVTVGVAAIEVTGLVKTYRLGDVLVEALKGVDLSISAGEFLAVMGPSGSGKSTLMNILGCLDRPTSGTYRLDGEEVGGLSRDGRAILRRSRLGFVFQGFNLLSRLSAKENVELPMIYDGTPASDRRERALSALSSVGLADRADHLPSQLSGGQQQRVAIARAIVNTPAMILADEPTGNLDSATSEEIMGIFQRLNDERGITMVLVTHEPDIALFAKRVIRFLDGRMVEDRPVENRHRPPAPRETAG